MPSAARRKPTRRDLLVVIGRLQDLIGTAIAHHGNDRDPNGFELGMGALEQGHQLCIDALSQDLPQQQTGPWADDVLAARTKD